MRAVFFGAGNVATWLSAAMQRAGHEVCQVYSRTEQSASRLAARLGCPCTTAWEEVVPDAELYIAALTDTALAEHVEQMTARKQGSPLFVHTAGSVPMTVWKGHAVRYGVLYPMQTFSRERETAFDHIPLFVEATFAEDTERLMELARSLSDTVTEADTEQRRCLHLAAVFTCNFTNHLYALADKLLREHGLPFGTMYPLLRETAEKVLGGMEPAKAQTGPAVRGDRQVMENHLAQLSGHPAWQTLYKALSESIQTEQL